MTLDEEVESVALLVHQGLDKEDAQKVVSAAALLHRMSVYNASIVDGGVRLYLKLVYA